ncbi:LysM peptidoglycan-binding domain-containing protein [Flavobacteriaceae bacterium]|jgi:LysM repeat protein|nr:LysM peptidoglycan-binding domain-containing protein [Flavobacteriaceae bacterium]
MKHFKFIFIFFLFISFFTEAQTPERFINHRVGKGESLITIIEKYAISESQLLEYNPLVGRVGVKRRMTLRIPVYVFEVKQAEKAASNTVTTSISSFVHLVTPKETKWRLAYQYGTTIAVLDSLNPEIKEGLKIGQEIRLPNFNKPRALPKKDSLYNYYKVLPKEGFYRIEKKLGVSQYVLDSLNPDIAITGLQAGMILKIPGKQSGKLKVENDLLVERTNLLDSSLQMRKIKLGVLLPFKAKEIIFDSIEDTNKILAGRNLHTISLDFYSGVLFAIKQAGNKGIDLELSTFDTENNPSRVQEIIQSGELKSQDLLVGPLIPNNFNLVSNESSLSAIPKIAPLSSNPVVFRKNVFQSVTQQAHFREKMYTHLESNIDSTHNVVIVTDSLNRSLERELKIRFPWAITLRPEKQDYLLPELVDSLLVDSLPNKVLLETQSFPLIASAISQFNAQNTIDREVQVYTSFRSNAYDNENLSRAVLGGVKFTYPVGFKPLEPELDKEFIAAFVNEYGQPPSKEALRGYDVVLDVILRTAIAKNLTKSLDLGETEYSSNRFLYGKEQNDAYVNKALFILQHEGYEIFEIKE